MDTMKVNNSQGAAFNSDPKVALTPEETKKKQQIEYFMHLLQSVNSNAPCHGCGHRLFDMQDPTGGAINIGLIMLVCTNCGCSRMYKKSVLLNSIALKQKQFADLSKCITE